VVEEGLAAPVVEEGHEPRVIEEGLEPPVVEDGLEPLVVEELAQRASRNLATGGWDSPSVRRARFGP
jgi:hypothetical protein